MLSYRPLNPKKHKTSLTNHLKGGYSASNGILPNNGATPIINVTAPTHIANTGSLNSGTAAGMGPTQQFGNENLLTCLNDLYTNIANQKKRTGSLHPKKFVARLRKDNGNSSCIIVEISYLTSLEIGFNRFIFRIFRQLFAARRPRIPEFSTQYYC